MRPRKIFVLLDGELLKQKLQTKNHSIIENKLTVLLPQPVANVDKTTRFTAGSVYNLSDLTRDEIQQLNAN